MIREKAYAKLNLNLHILPHKLINGFYEVRFINCELDLHDELTFKNMEREIKIISDKEDLPEMHHNLVYKAAILLKEITGNKKLGAKIILDKKIPIKAGLGGGSTDAASAIKGLVRLWNLNVTKAEVDKLASKLGKDVFYSSKGGLCEIRGDGSEIMKLNLKTPIFYLIVITPNLKKPSTQWMYQHLDLKNTGKHIGSTRRFIHKPSLHDLHNDFEITALQYFPVIKQIKKDLERNKAEKTLLAGSGLSIVGFYPDEAVRDKAYQALSEIYSNVICTKTR